MKTTTRSRLSLALCIAHGTAAFACLQTADAVADDAPIPARVVQYADLDLSKPAGVRTLYQRIAAAARQVCETSVGYDPHLLSREQVCIKESVARAVEDVNSAGLATLAAMPLHLARQ